MKPDDSLLLKNVTHQDGRVADIICCGGTVRHAGAGGPAGSADTVIDCTGLIVIPAAVDIHVHMRGGPQSAKEDWGSGSRSALAGGVTVVVDQPNTIPPLTNPDAFRNRVADAREHSLCSFAINSGVTPETPLADMWAAGAMAFGETFFAPSSYSDAIDEKGLTSALSAIRGLEALATIHAEEVGSGEDSSLPAHAALRSPEGELRAVRVVGSCNPERCRLHFCHMSTGPSVDAAPGTVEVTPHHLFLSHERFRPDDAKGKMNPPLRSERERKELWKRWNRIDCVASDHAPHTIDEKAAGFAAAPSGVPGVETMIPLLMAEVLEKRIGLLDLIRKTSLTPSRIMGIPPAGFAPGCRADFALYRRETERIDAGRLHSRCGWTPFEGMKAAFPVMTVLGGRIVYNEGEFTPGPARWFPGRGYVSP